ncbi:hypothetical protein [Amycolatopsis sp. MEPSY49]|uniref:hypothetical protein n=1 Tax=Amycolatopsis sp. MEPSY49 TaxID=3151600 RepID=UPI003EF7F428
MRGLADGVKSLPLWGRCSAATLALAAVMVAAVAAAGLRNGTPELTATGYQLYTRLGSTPITHAEYLQELAGSERLFAALGVGLVVLLAAGAAGSRTKSVTPAHHGVECRGGQAGRSAEAGAT